jgi:hypothetical protein
MATVRTKRVSKEQALHLAEYFFRMGNENYSWRWLLFWAAYKDFEKEWIDDRP